MAETIKQAENKDFCDVLVVGLGPIGATLAGLLKTQGLSVIAIDKEADIYPLPRATAFDDEAMRIFQMLGISEVLEKQCRALGGYQFLSASRQILSEFRIPVGVGPRGWNAVYASHQPDLEATMRRRIEELGVDLRLSASLTNFKQDLEGVVAQIDGPARSYEIKSKYIVGCDGANSRVRTEVGGGVFDYGFSERWLVVDATIKNAADLPQIPIQICDPLQPTTFGRITGDRYRWEFMLKPGDDPETFSSDETLSRLLKPWNGVGTINIERRAIYRFRALLANKWRNGRALLAGDAAHLMPPFAGQGMCSGIRDAGNLSWKIAAVIKGEAGDELLDSYQREREPHVRGIIERSIEFGQTICILDPVIAAQRDAGMLAMRAAGKTPEMLPMPPLYEGCLMGGEESGSIFMQPVIDNKRMDDELGAGAWLITFKPTTLPLGTITQFMVGSEALGLFNAPLRDWLNQRASEAVLVRPDRHVFGIGHPDECVSKWHERLSH